MTETAIPSNASTEREDMHTLYRQGGGRCQMAPHVVYSEPTCPHPGCDCRMQAIDFRLEDHGKEVHNPLVTAWWNDTGFAGQCPECGGWVHFTIRGKHAVTSEEASRIPRLPGDWFTKATVL